ncbi:MAG: Bax inhibitor-1/YccA family protein [Bacteroidales bacterium]
MNNDYGYLSSDRVKTQSNLIQKVYGWMAAALVVTGVTSFVVAGNQTIQNLLFSNPWFTWGLFFVQLGLVIFLSARVMKMSAATASAMFIVYSFVTGVVLSLLFTLYTKESLASTFFISAALFGVMTLYGWTTKKDLTSAGSLFFMGLIGVIIASVVNIFLKSTVLYWITTYIGVFIFVGLIAYDTQKLKQLAGMETSETSSKLAIIGALSLYLDFINLFLLLLRIFGRRN